MPLISSSSSSPHGFVPAAFKRASLLPRQATSSSTTSPSCACCPAGGGAAVVANAGAGTTHVAAAVVPAAQQQQRNENIKNNTVVLCPSCVIRYLQSARHRRQQVLEEHAALQRACREKFAPLQNTDNDGTATVHNNNNINATAASATAACCNRLWQMQQQEWHQTWLPRWEYLRRATSHVAVQVARLKFENEQRNESLQIMARENVCRRQLLHRWKQALLLTTTTTTTREQQQDHQHQHDEEEKKRIDGRGGGNDNVVLVNRSEHGLGAMAMAVMEARQQVRRLRFQWALYAFQLHKLHVGDDHHYNNNNNKNTTTTTSRDTQAAVCRGIGKIGGCLPLPHAGPELYVFLPPPELQSALRLVASLTSMVAACLGILLPHPILLQQQQPQSSLNDSTPTKMAAAAQANSPTVVNNATPSRFEYTYCRDLAMRAAAAVSVEQPNDYYHRENEDWQEPFQNSAAATTPPATRTSSTSSSSTANKTAATTLSTSYLVSLAGQTFRRATGGGGGSTPTIKTGATLTATRTVASSSNNNDTRISTTTTRRQQEVVGIPPPLSMDPASIERRIHHATAAVLAENEHGSLYTLAAPGTIISSSSSSSSSSTGLGKTTDEISSSDHLGAKTNNNKSNQNDSQPQHNNATTTTTTTVVVDSDHFAIALQLLQNNIICLCIRAGVPVTNLWPAQAVLLNLQALQDFCQEQTTTLSPTILVHRR